MPQFTIEELVVPARIDSADASDVLEVIEIRNVIEVASYGLAERRLRPDELLPFWQDAQAPIRLFGVRIDGRIVAAGHYEWLLDDAEGCWLTVHVLPGFRRQGIGTALHEHLAALAVNDGRSKLIVYAAHGAADGERLPAPTGFGSVPAGNAEVRALLGAGYRLEQIERCSLLRLPIEVTVPTPAEGYRLVYWQDHTPTERLDDMALMFTRMSTDAPTAGLDEPEDVYTPERVLEYEAAQESSPRTQIVVAVEHIESGQLAGFSELRIPVENDRAVSQGDTLVLREHRGHGLGMLLKAANLDRLQREFPGHPCVITFNAEENRYMLDVNEAVGFVPVGYEGAWRKDLP